MTILVPGRTVDNLFYGTCTLCDCRISVEQKELRDYYSGDQRDPGECGSVVCPTEGCNSIIAVYRKR